MPASLRSDYPINHANDKRLEASVWMAGFGGIRRDMINFPSCLGISILRVAEIKFLLIGTKRFVHRRKRLDIHVSGFRDAN